MDGFTPRGIASLYLLLLFVLLLYVASGCIFTVCITDDAEKPAVSRAEVQLLRRRHTFKTFELILFFR